MNGAIQLIFFGRMLAVGIISPVLALMLMAHGATIETVSLLIGVYSATVIAAEFPSGVLADLFGQKQAFLLSVLFAVLSFVLVLFSRSMWVLIAAMVATGLSRAFSSGTLDALAVNLAQARDEHALLKITSRFSMLESAGLALGALMGGLMAGIGDGYIVNIAANIALYALLFFGALFFIHENKPVRRTVERKPLHSLINGQIKQSIAFILQKGIVRAILVLSVATGFALISVEAYWQPTYTAFNPPAWTLGLVSFAGFASVMAGTKLITVFMKRQKSRVAPAFLLMRALLGVGLIGLFFATHALSFIGVYMLSYFFLGGSSVAESTLIHRCVQDDQRSSILSLFSFIVQIGGILASGAGYFVSKGGDYRLMWPLSGALLVVCAASLMRTARIHKTGRRTSPARI